MAQKEQLVISPAEAQAFADMFSTQCDKIFAEFVEPIYQESKATPEMPATPAAKIGELALGRPVIETPTL